MAVLSDTSGKSIGHGQRGHKVSSGVFLPMSVSRKWPKQRAGSPAGEYKKGIGPVVTPLRALRQLIQQRLRILQVRFVETLAEPAIRISEQFTCFVRVAPI